MTDLSCPGCGASANTFYYVLGKPGNKQYITAWHRLGGVWRQRKQNMSYLGPLHCGSPECSGFAELPVEPCILMGHRWFEVDWRPTDEWQMESML